MRVQKKLKFAVILIAFLISTPAWAVPYDSYTYNYWEAMVPAPQAYVPEYVVSGSQLGVGEFRNPQDISIHQHLGIFLLDTGNNRIVRFDEDLRVVQEITGFENDGRKDGFSNPRGIHVSDEHIYVADRDNARIVVLSLDGSLVRLVHSPADYAAEYFTSDFRFRPEKISVDQYGTMYVVAGGVYDGIMEFDQNGVFLGFKGAPRVTPSAADYFWRRVGTIAQRERMSLFLPVEHSNLFVDERGFVYATAVAGSIRDEERIRRLNTAGTDVLRRMASLPPVGDFLIPPTPPEDFNMSLFVDIVARPYEMYSVLDRERGRVFTYDSVGNLLYVFGALGDQKGTFRNPVAIGALGDRLVVLDGGKSNLVFFRPTEYTQAIHQAVLYHYTGNFDNAAKMWQKVLEMNSNLDMAYTGIANALLLQGQFKEAMNNYRLANNRLGYSEAFRYYRKEFIETNFLWICLFSILGIVVLLRATKKRGSETVAEIKGKIAATYDEVISWEKMPKRSFVTNLKRTWRALQFALKVIFSPFDGFWDLKHEHRGNLPAAVIIIFSVAITWVISRQYTGFVFNVTNPRDLNLVAETFSIVFPFLLWTGINWSLTTLMNGKGNARDIFIASAFALTPFVLINLPLTLVSNFLILEEGSFFYFFLAISVIWSFALLVLGTMVTHDYSFGETLFVTLLIIIGIGITLFLGLVFLDIVLQFTGFLVEVYNEFVYTLL